MHMPSQHCEYSSRFNKTNLNAGHMNGYDNQNRGTWGISLKTLPDKFLCFLITVGL